MSPCLYLASDVTLTLLLFTVVLVVAGLVTLVLVVAPGCIQPLDLVAQEFVEDRIGVEIPLVRRFLPHPRTVVRGAYRPSGVSTETDAAWIGTVQQ